MTAFMMTCSRMMNSRDGINPMKDAPMSGLLVSVRNAQEAELAVAGGAALIDVKEPAHGALGRAADATIEAVIRAVAGRRPVSAALGELIDDTALPRCSGLSFVKWGLAGAARLDWRSELMRRSQLPGPRMVVAAYADWECAQAPPVADVTAFAWERPGSVLLVDTHCKDATPPIPPFARGGWGG